MSSLSRNAEIIVEGQRVELIVVFLRYTEGILCLLVLFSVHYNGVIPCILEFFLVWLFLWWSLSMFNLALGGD